MGESCLLTEASHYKFGTRKVPPCGRARWMTRYHLCVFRGILACLWQSGPCCSFTPGDNAPTRPVCFVSCPCFAFFSSQSFSFFFLRAVRNGHIKRITDQDIQSSVLEMCGTNVSTNYISCPADPSKTLGIKLPFLVMIIKNVRAHAFHKDGLDDGHTLAQPTIIVSVADY
jgi:hypothetical protein